MYFFDIIRVNIFVNIAEGTSEVNKDRPRSIDITYVSLSWRCTNDFLQNIQKNFKHLFLKYTILMLFFQALLNDAYNHKGTIEILTNVGESLMQIVKVEEKGN